MFAVFCFYFYRLIVLLLLVLPLLSSIGLMCWICFDASSLCIFALNAAIIFFLLTATAAGFFLLRSFFHLIFHLFIRYIELNCVRLSIDGDLCSAKSGHVWKISSYTFITDEIQIQIRIIIDAVNSSVIAIMNESNRWDERGKLQTVLVWYTNNAIIIQAYVISIADWSRATWTIYCWLLLVILRICCNIVRLWITQLKFTANLGDGHWYKTRSIVSEIFHNASD